MVLESIIPFEEQKYIRQNKKIESELKNGKMKQGKKILV